MSPAPKATGSPIPEAASTMSLREYPLPLVRG